MGSLVSKPLLVTVNGAAGLLLLAMTDIDSSTRLLVAAALAVNVLLVIGKRSLVTAPARLGACASLAGYVGTVGSWLVLALGCGIEYYNGRCDAVVIPIITTCLILSLVGLPVGRILGIFAKSDA